MSRHTTAAMIRALTWKEWREQRSLVVAGLALAILIPPLLIAGSAATSRPLDMAKLAGVLPMIYIVMLWPLMAAAAGGAAIANEIHDGTIGFLLSRPASRLRIWAVKVFMAFGSSLVILIGSLVIAWIFGLMAAPTAPTELAEGGFPLATIIRPVTVLLFASSVFFSTFLSRAMTAAAAGLVASAMILAGLFLIWSRLELYPHLEPEWMALEVILGAGLVLLASLYVFWRGELLRGVGMRRLVPMASMVAVGALGLVTVPLVQAHGRLRPSSVDVVQMAPSPSGDAIVETVTAKDRAIPQIWLIHSDASGMERLTGSLTFGPSISPDGKWIAYFSRRGPFGLSRDFPEQELRAIRVDGTDDHYLATLASYSDAARTQASIAFSPDSERVAAIGSELLLIAFLRGGAVRTTRLARTPLEQASIAGWSADGEEILVLSDSTRRANGGSSMLAAVNAVSGRFRPLYRSPEKTSIWLLHQRPAGWTRVPIVVGSHLVLVDPASGDAETISDYGGYWSSRISDKGDELAYAVSRRLTGSASESEIHVRELSGRSDKTLAIVPGLAGEILWSPSGEAWVVNRYADRKPIPPPSILIGRDGQSKELPSGWVCIGWYGRERMLLKAVGDDPALAVLDAASGDLRRIFP